VAPEAIAPSPSVFSDGLPADLVPLPQYPPHSRYPTILPIDPDQARSALWHAAGNLSTAAQLLAVSPARLASLVARDPVLKQERALASELLIDRAEQVMAQELDGENASDAARWILDRAGRSRGYGKDAPPNLSFGAGTSGAIAIRWESE
jgi:hypothetical protein